MDPSKRVAGIGFMIPAEIQPTAITAKLNQPKFFGKFAISQLRNLFDWNQVLRQFGLPVIGFRFFV